MTWREMVAGAALTFVRSSDAGERPGDRAAGPRVNCAAANPAPAADEKDLAGGRVGGVPMALTYFEDIEEGESHTLGTHEVTEAEIVDFAEEWDPQPFHVDEAAAADSAFGGIIASGMHTLSICQRLVTDGFYEETANISGLGIEDTRFLEPVRPGDRLTAHIDIAETRPLESRDDRGLVAIEQRLTNQDDDVVLSSRMLALFERQ
jgi:acyl dehydratase